MELNQLQEDAEPMLATGCVPVLFVDDFDCVEVFDGNVRMTGLRRRVCQATNRIVREPVFVLIIPGRAVRRSRSKVDAALRNQRAAHLLELPH